MLKALYIGATGMQMQQLSVDTIANNLANLNTAGYKKTRVNFSDLVYNDPSGVAAAGAGFRADNAGQTGPLSSWPSFGSGVGVAGIAKVFDPGVMTQTGSNWDVAIQGDGFLQVNLADGSIAYARGGTLKVNSDGLLTTQSGQVLKPAIAVPANATGLTVAADGTVSATVPNQGKPIHLGQLSLVRFTNPSGLQAIGDNVYRSGEASGEPITGAAGQDGLGTFQQGMLEGSNVNMTDEVVNLMVAKRAYEASLKVMQASDEMLGLVNNLRR